MGGDIEYDKNTNTGNGTNVWGKPLPKGEISLVFLSNENDAVDVTCDQSCFAQLNIPSTTTSFTVRDLWAHQDLGALHAPFNYTAKAVSPHGGVQMFKLTPA